MNQSVPATAPRRGTPRRKDIVGKRFGYLTVLAFSHRNISSHWLMRCDCGNEIVGRIDGRRKVGQSCGCMKNFSIGRANTTHGLSRTALHRVWSSMRNRCNNKKHRAYPRYGGRGISVCERWSSFENFLADMGSPPPGMSIDRFPDNNGNYEPGNCRWATRKEQQANTRTNRTVVIDGIAMCCTEAVRMFGVVSPSTFRDRLDKGWPPREAASTAPKRLPARQWERAA